MMGGSNLSSQSRFRTHKQPVFPKKTTESCRWCFVGRKAFVFRKNNFLHESVESNP